MNFLHTFNFEKCQRMDKESTYLLQCVDCNCNDCVFMQRDTDRYARSLEFHRGMQEKEFVLKKAKAILDAEALENPKGREVMLQKAHKMKFQFDKTAAAIQYGTCTKYNRMVSFIPGVLQLHTQECFEHRRKNQIQTTNT